MREYANRADVFGGGATHVLLALGSLAAAVQSGLPLGILAHRGPGCAPACCGS